MLLILPLLLVLLLLSTITTTSSSCAKAATEMELEIETTDGIIHLTITEHDPTGERHVKSELAATNCHLLFYV